jgi:hypothetical protein
LQREKRSRPTPSPRLSSLFQLLFRILQRIQKELSGSLLAKSKKIGAAGTLAVHIESQPDGKHLAFLRLIPTPRSPYKGVFFSDVEDPQALDEECQVDVFDNRAENAPEFPLLSTWRIYSARAYR